MTTTTATHRTAETTEVSAPLDVIRDLILDVERWPQHHPAAIHAEHDEDGGITFWSLAGPAAVRTWRAERTVREDGVDFVSDPVAPPFAELGGGFDLDPVSGTRTVVRLRHEFSLLRQDEAVAARHLAVMSESGARYLESLRRAAERRAELELLTISFEDPLFVSGAIEDVYAYLYEADKWPERIPHVKRLVLEEPQPGVQFFDMDTVTPEGAPHTTRSVRICLPQHKIVYKQVQPPKALEAHTGHWQFQQTPEGVLAGARHTVTIKPDMLQLFGEGATVQDARRYLRRVLGANSLGNLRLAKADAERRAGL
jgi:C7-C12 aromatase (ARO/CYC)